MKYLCKWDLPTLDEPVIERLERSEVWGLSFFWYCFQCRQIYANMQVFPEDCSRRTWQAISGLCLTCLPDCWHVRGTLECIYFIRWNVPSEVAQYQLDREIDFLCHPNHPHNKEYTE